MSGYKVPPVGDKEAELWKKRFAAISDDSPVQCKARIMTGWQPIDTAPKTGLRAPRIDLWVHEPHKGGYRVPDVFWHHGQWKITIQLGFKISAFAARHTAMNWRLRPEPPKDYPMPARLTA